uniref:Uncharacterized protein n=1 Tax=Anguilla anguilla TaxID=7936 RepID=A0A0E9WG14_ANGAN
MCCKCCQYSGNDRPLSLMWTIYVFVPVTLSVWVKYTQDIIGILNNL